MQQDLEASSSDWESRLQEAVDSAEQWKAFAEKLGGEKGNLDSEVVKVREQLQVKQRPRGDNADREECAQMEIVTLNEPSCAWMPLKG